MAFVPVVVLAVLTILSAVTVTRMIRQDARAGVPPRSHHGDGPPRAWWTDGEPPPETDPPGPRVLLVDHTSARSPARRPGPGLHR